MESTLKRTWAEIDLDALARNYDRIRRHVGEETKLLGVIKADAYGHGAVPVARELEALGASYLAVSNIDECEEVRRGGVKLPVLMLGFTPADQAERILELDMTQAVQSLDIAEAFSDAAVKCGKKMKVHLKLDTGMGRLGFPCDETNFAQSLTDILAVLKLPGLDVEGIFTHFCISDEEGEENVAFTKKQHERYARMIAQAEEDRTAYSETPANAFGGLMADLFTVKEDRWTPVLRQFGRSLGKLIYFMDAACDLEADRKKNQYNPLALLGIQSGADFRPQLTLLAGDAAEAFECLPIVQDAALLQNILYSGVWTRFDAAFAAKQEGQT